MAWEILGQYELHERVGRGGAATVWKARHLLLQSTHAVKVLTADSEELARRMLREGRVQARLRHPAIVPVTDLIQADHNIALVMPFIEGGTLEDRLQAKGPMAPGPALEIFRQLLDGLHHAHEAGVLHRDLKPANIMLDGAQARITDFGLAGLVETPGEGERLTRVGIALGTPGYMAPELWLEPSTADARADIFSLAAVLYDMMAGRAPFSGESPRQVFDATMTGQFVPLDFQVPGCPPQVAELVADCLAAEVERRPISCRALAERLGWDLDERSLPPQDDDPPAPALPPLPHGSSIGGLSIVAPYADMMEDAPTEVASNSPTLEPELPPGRVVAREEAPRLASITPVPTDSQELPPPVVLPPRRASLPTWSHSELGIDRPMRTLRPADSSTPAAPPPPAEDPGFPRGWLYTGVVGLLVALALLVAGIQRQADLKRERRAARDAARAAQVEAPPPPVKVCAGEGNARLGWLYVESERAPEAGAVMELVSLAELRVAPPIEGVRAAVACQLPGGQRIKLGEGAVVEGEGRYWVPVDGEDILVAPPAEGD